MTEVADECGVALTNTYYMAGLMRSDKPEYKAVVGKVGVAFHNQSGWETHVNIASFAVANDAPHRANGIKFLEYLASPTAHSHFVDGNNEWPAAKGIHISNPALQAMSGGNFKSETVPISVVGMNQVKVQQLLDRVGLK
jgi:iron(III) transport system substrate-binding protein